MEDDDTAIALVRGEDASGARVYAFVGVPARNLRAFLDARDRDDFKPGDYGEILEQGVGEPSAETSRRMRDRYGYDAEHISNRATDAAGETLRAVAGKRR